MLLYEKFFTGLELILLNKLKRKTKEREREIKGKREKTERKRERERNVLCTIKKWTIYKNRGIFLNKDIYTIIFILYLLYISL
jgi:hypothetical protein